jgi:hypothetical protein
MKTIFTLLAAVLLLSCAEKETPKVIYGASKVEGKTTETDTANIEIADLPIAISETDVLIHPIGSVRVNPDTRSYSATGGSGISYHISNYNIFEITGFLSNLKFQKVGSDSLKVLTSKQVLIETASYLKPLADKLKLRLMVYSLADSDTNKDGKLDGNDIKTLYMSTLDGEKFTKLTPDMEELIDWKLIESQGRLYFRTVEDTNKNGAFDKSDLVHYSFVDLKSDSWQVTSYKPI